MPRVQRGVFLHQQLRILQRISGSADQLPGRPPRLQLMDWNSEEAHTGNHLHLYDNWKLTPGIWRLASLLQLL